MQPWPWMVQTSFIIDSIYWKRVLVVIIYCAKTQQIITTTTSKKQEYCLPGNNSASSSNSLGVKELQITCQGNGGTSELRSAVPSTGLQYHGGRVPHQPVLCRIQPWEAGERRVKLENRFVLLLQDPGSLWDGLDNLLSSHSSLRT